MYLPPRPKGTSGRGARPRSGVSRSSNDDNHTSDNNDNDDNDNDISNDNTNTNTNTDNTLVGGFASWGSALDGNGKVAIPERSELQARLRRRFPCRQLPRRTQTFA